MSLLIVTPTIGRLTLRRTLDSAASTLHENDQWIVVGDGPQPGVEELVMEYGESFLYRETATRTMVYGNAQRNLALDMLKNNDPEFEGITHVCFIDDDDIYTTGAIDRLHEAMTVRPDVMHTFPVWVGWNAAGGNLAYRDMALPGILVPRTVNARFDGKGIGEDLRFAVECNEQFEWLSHGGEDILVTITPHVMSVKNV
jgi:glycosyltransferase involved in cell wall biosynthesis